jgi:hypothetical protein
MSIMNRRSGHEHVGDPAIAGIFKPVVGFAGPIWILAFTDVISAIIIYCLRRLSAQIAKLCSVVIGRFGATFPFGSGFFYIARRNHCSKVTVAEMFLTSM